jgi:pimeloyl-ACP methyl ester carboxylesterase
MREGHVEWRLGRTWYRVAGGGGRGVPPLLALHGGPGSTHHYFAPLEQLADERAVVVYDQLGCGASPVDCEIAWSVALFLEELDALREELGLARVHLLGTSWGGMLALEHVLARPSGVASLVLSSTLASAAEWASEVKRLRDAIPTADDDEANEELGRRHVFRGDRERAEIRRGRAERGKDVYRAMWGRYEWEPAGVLREWDVRPRLGEIRAPTLVIRGGHDLSTAAVSRTLVDGIAGAREVVLENASHTPVSRRRSVISRCCASSSPLPTEAAPSVVRRLSGAHELRLDRVEHVARRAFARRKVTPLPLLEIGVAADEPLLHRHAVDLLLEPLRQFARQLRPVLGRHAHERREVLPAEDLHAHVTILRPLRTS